MRELLISEIKELSESVCDDDLQWFEFHRYSNKELLEMYKELAISEYESGFDD